MMLARASGLGAGVARAESGAAGAVAGVGDAGAVAGGAEAAVPAPFPA